MAGIPFCKRNLARFGLNANKGAKGLDRTGRGKYKDSAGKVVQGKNLCEPRGIRASLMKACKNVGKVVHLVRLEGVVRT